jgi:pheromone shutdown protein TraB
MASTPPGASAALTHPSGSRVYLVGVAHVSAKAAEDAESCILAVQPAVVVLELDEKRYRKLMQSAASSDPFGVQRVAHGGVLKPLQLVFRGELLEYGLGVAYSLAGALLGVPPGQEFRAAIQAAERVGAEIVLADRDQDTTLRRLSRAALLAQQRPEGLPTAADPGHPRPMAGDTPPSKRPKPDEVLNRMTDRWKQMLEAAGCSDPDRVLNSFARILAQGSGKQGRVDPQDLAVVRDCGEKAIETYREKAVKEDDSMLDAMEVEALKEVGASTGLTGFGAAITSVVQRERDLILARRLWEAGEKAAGRDVVGVVGA